MKELLRMLLLLMFSFNQVVLAEESDADADADADASKARVEVSAVQPDESITTESIEESERVDCFYEENRANEICASER